MAERAWCKNYGEGVCKICGKTFKKKCVNAVVCSEECRKKKHNKQMVEYMNRRYAMDPEYRETRKRYHIKSVEKKANKNA